VLEVLASKLDGEATVGEIVDAANALGWSDGIGELTLGDLADALLSANGEGDSAARTGADARGVPTEDEDEASDEDDEDDEEDDEDDDEDEDEESDEDEEAPARGKAKGRAAKATTKAKPTAKAKGKATKAAAAPAAKAAKGKSGRTKATVSLDERMSLQEAAKAIVPLVQALGHATMQELEASTKAGRRKLRFHIGQLVRHGYLERHGMGRGTYYTAR
jgi:DNA-binding transcriptional ArsR family regulator